MFSLLAVAAPAAHQPILPLPSVGEKGEMAETVGNASPVISPVIVTVVLPVRQAVGVEATPPMLRRHVTGLTPPKSNVGCPLAAGGATYTWAAVEKSLTDEASDARV